MTGGALNPAYVGPRPDVERLVPDDVRCVLDVGCSTGVLGAAIKARTGARVTGVELSSEMAEVARSNLDEVLVGDAAAVLGGEALAGRTFDAVVFADILEHLVDPWAVLRAARWLVAPGGVVIASLPNVRHLDTLFNVIVRGTWPYRDRGIHDRTHLRFFTRRNVVELFEQAELAIERIDTNYRIIERPHRWNRLARLLAIPGLRGFLAFQYLVRARRSV